MNVKDAYFNWMYDTMCKNVCSNDISYMKLFRYLHSVPFTYDKDFTMDGNREEDGIDLRYRFAYDHLQINNAEKYITGPCSVLEMLVAFAIRCEECIMDDPKYGDRTSQWFWGMIKNLGLGTMSDNKFDKQYVEMVVRRFLDRDYEPNGKGGLFTIRGCTEDLRTIDLWCQLCWYLDTIA